MKLIENDFSVMCYFITSASCYYPDKDIHAFRTELITPPIYSKYSD